MCVCACACHAHVVCDNASLAQYGVTSKSGTTFVSENGQQQPSSGAIGQGKGYLDVTSERGDIELTVARA